jgi:hypothetical protein
MELSNLKLLRKIVPGVYIIGCSYPFLPNLSNVYSHDASPFIVICVGAVIGFVYDALGWRRLRNRKSHQRINDNIKDLLIEYGLTRPASAEEVEKLKSSTNLRSVFYQLVDNDPSLIEKSRNVRDNGLFWTSTADVALISCVYTWIYCFSVWLLSEHYASVGLIIGAIGLISGCFLHPLAVNKHIALSNEQIQHIVLTKKKELEEKVNGLLNVQ